MPGMDRTGPMSDGPMTGGGWGRCNPANRAEILPIAAALGRSRGFGGRLGDELGTRRGRCRARWRPMASGPGAPADTAAEIEKLQAEAEMLTTSLDRLNKRIEALRNKESEQR